MPESSPEISPSQSSHLPSDSQSEVQQKFIFMFFSFPEGPIDYRLYAVKVPNLSLSLTDPKTETGDFFSVVEFSSGTYPISLTCVQLDSKFYFLGGSYPRNFSKSLGRLDGSSDVFIIDTEKILMADKHEKSNNIVNADMLLEKGTPMNNKRRSRKDYIFVANRKIYAVKSSVPTPFLKDVPPHSEVFDPDSDKWTSLPDPPIFDHVVGHAVKDDKIYIVTSNSKVFYLAPDNAKWMPLSGYFPPEVFQGKAEFVEDRLYGCHLFTLMAYRPLSGHNDDSESDRLCMTRLAPDVEDAYTDHLIGCPDDVDFVHLGNEIFCLIFGGCARDKDHPESCNLENLGISLIFFKALNKTFTVADDDDDDITYFQADLLHSAHFVTKIDAGEELMWRDYFCLHDCFYVSSIAKGFLHPL